MAFLREYEYGECLFLLISLTDIYLKNNICSNKKNRSGNFATPVESVKKRPFFPLISIYLSETYNFLQKSIYCENEYG